MWYALKIGFTWEEALDQPVGRLLTLMAIEQIKHEGARIAGETPEGGLGEDDVFDSESMDIDEVFPDLK